MNGFGEREVLTVIFNICENPNESTGIERELYPIDYRFNGVLCPPFLVNIEKSADIPVFGLVLAKFTKNGKLGHSLWTMQKSRFHVWATNKSN